MDKKKYHLRIFRHEELDLVLLTISDHGKFIETIENGKTQTWLQGEVKFSNLEILGYIDVGDKLLGTVCLDDKFDNLVTDFKYWSSRELN